MANDGQRSYDLGRPNRAMDDWALRLWGDIVEGAEKPAFLYWDFRYGRNDNYREIEVGLNLRKQGKEGKIRAYLPSPIFRAFCNQIIAAAQGKMAVGASRVFECTTQMVAGRRVDKPVVDVRVVVGMDEEGPWVTLHKRNFPFTRCRFSAPMNWRLVDNKGVPFNVSEVACIMAEAVAGQWMSFMENVLMNKYMDDKDLVLAKEDKKKLAFGNSGKANYGNNNQQRSGGQPTQQPAWGDQSSEPAKDFDDDIPF